MNDGAITAFLQTLFYNDNEYAPGLQEKLVENAGHADWSLMKPYKSKYLGYEAKCKYCGAIAWASFKPGSTKGWRDQQRANIMQFLDCPVPDRYMQELEQTLPTE